MEIAPVRPDAPKARRLIQQLDADLTARYPGEPVQGIDPAEFAKSGGYFVVASEGKTPVGCGAFRPLAPGQAEIKRMFVDPDYRRQGCARTVLRHLEVEIRRRGIRTIVLETGFAQPEAIAFYLSEGYGPIPPFGPYAHGGTSRCFSKQLV